MDAGNGKSRDFRLSQAPANQVVRKGVCGDFILCGLSPPVSASWSLVHRYTLWNAQDRNRSSKVWAVTALRISEYRLNRTFTLDGKKAIPKSFIAASRTRPWLLSGWECRGRRLSRG